MEHIIALSSAMDSIAEPSLSPPQRHLQPTFPVFNYPDPCPYVPHVKGQVFLPPVHGRETSLFTAICLKMRPHKLGWCGCTYHWDGWYRTGLWAIGFYLCLLDPFHQLRTTFYRYQSQGPLMQLLQRRLLAREDRTLFTIDLHHIEDL